MNYRRMMTAMVVATSMVCATAQDLKLRSDNIDEVLSALTLHEKAQLVVGTGMRGFEQDGPIIGSADGIVPGAAGYTCAIPRLGIPAIVLADGPAGLRIDPVRDFDSHNYYCTHFPIGTCLSSSWNTELVSQVGRAMGNEVLEYGADVYLAPAENIHRSPLCGRNFEYYSEDPVLSGNIAAAYINGVQSMGVGTSLKHFAVNNQETQRMGTDARVSQRALREIYLKGFEIAVKKAQPWTVMSSYNKVNGIYTPERSDLLKTILRDEWGFRGLVMTDWGGGTDRVASMKAGNDLIEPGNPKDTETIENAVKNGQLDEKILDENVRRVLELVVKSPRFHGYQYSNQPDLQAHAQVTRISAAEGIVLLKNESMLPFASSIKHVAVYGCTSYDIIPGGTGSGNVNRAYTVSLIEGLRNNGYTVDGSLLVAYKKHMKQWAKDHPKSNYDWWQNVPRAAEYVPTANELDTQVKNNDVAIITLGRISGEGQDRVAVDFNLTDEERQLINAVTAAYHQVGKKVVVVLNVGGVMETASWKDIPDAILLPWQCGQEGGNSIADILSGRLSPSGKLPMTFPVDLMDHYSSKNFPLDAPKIPMGNPKKGEEQNRKNIDYTNYEEGIYVGYRYFDTFEKTVSYPFGYGLSYTTFSYSNPSVKENDGTITVQVTVTNTGNRPGKEVAEVYVTAPKGSVQKPAQELKTFAKTKELKPNESQVLTMTLNKKDLASFNTKQSAWVVDAGTYKFNIGTSSRDIKCSTTLKTKATREKVHNVLAPVVKINELSKK